MKEIQIHAAKILFIHTSNEKGGYCALPVLQYDYNIRTVERCFRILGGGHRLFPFIYRLYFRVYHGRQAIHSFMSTIMAIVIYKQLIQKEIK